MEHEWKKSKERREGRRVGSVPARTNSGMRRRYPHKDCVVPVTDFSGRGPRRDWSRAGRCRCRTGARQWEGRAADPFQSKSEGRFRCRMAEHRASWSWWPCTCARKRKTGKGTRRWFARCSAPPDRRRLFCSPLLGGSRVQTFEEALRA